jgi:hypothetical protein
MYGDAQDLYYEIVARNANSADAWRGYLAVLHLKQADRAVAAEIPHIPSAVRAQLEADPSFLILKASKTKRQHSENKNNPAHERPLFNAPR